MSFKKGDKRKMANNKPQEEIVLCKMFSGNYWEDANNIGYESINMFLPDDQALAIEPISYIYLPANGDYKLEEHKITHVLLVRSEPNTDGKVVQIIGKAEVVDGGELLRKQDGSSKISKCIGGKEFVGLSNIVKIFNSNIEDNEDPLAKINNDGIKSKIEEIAKCYGRNKPNNKEDYFELAVVLGFKNAINRKLSDADFIDMCRKHKDEILANNKNKIEKEQREKIREEVEQAAKKNTKIKIVNEKAYTEYNYWYAKSKGWIESKKLSNEDLISLVELYPDKFESPFVGEDLSNSEKNFNYAKSILGEAELTSLLEGVMSEDEFCDLVVKQYTNHAKALREIFLSEEQKIVRNVIYGGLTYGKIFSGNKHYGALNICASLKVKNLHLVDKAKKLYLMTDDKYSKKYNGAIVIVEKNLGHKKISATSQTVYISNKDEFWNKICEEDCWVRSQPLFIENLPYLQDSFLTVVKKEYDELSYSNLFAHFFRKNSKFVKHFFTKIKDKKVDIKELEGEIKANSEEISDDDWKDIGGANVEREEKNIDIVVSDKNSVIVIENKIKSALNGKEINDNGRVYKDQLIRYFKYITKKYPNKEPHFFIFAPNYNNIENEDFGKVNKQEMKDKWNIVRYSDIFECCKEYDYKNDNGFDEFDKKLFYEFLKALNVHTDSSANNYYRQMQKRLNKIKNSLESNH